MYQVPRRRRNGSAPTVLLVHCAFTTTYCWHATMNACQDLDAELVAVPNPLRGLASDARYLAAVASTVDGPVVLVGHGYGGAVTTVAGAAAANVVGLVYVAGFALRVGESCIDIIGRSGRGPLPQALLPVVLPSTGDPAGMSTELYLRRDAFAGVYAGDLTRAMASVAAASQLPITARALEETAASAGWQDVPSWYLIATADRMVDPEAQRRMAVRAGATAVEVEASHAVPMSAPAAVAGLIRSALSTPPSTIVVT